MALRQLTAGDDAFCKDVRHLASLWQGIERAMLKNMQATPRRVSIRFVSVALLMPAVVLAVGLLIALRDRSWLRASETPANEAPTRLGVLWEVPPFAFVDEDGRRVTEQTFRGHPWIADFIFTRCTTACPLITAKMRLLQRSLPQRTLRFASFSVDPEFDTPSVLGEYAARWGGDPRWHLLSTDHQSLGTLSRAMKVAVEPSLDPENPIAHSTLFFLIDDQGKVRGFYDSLDAHDMQRLVADANVLSGDDHSAIRATLTKDREPAAPGSDRVAQGRALASALGCNGCHDNPHLAPSLHGLAGRQVKLEKGAQATADEGYLRQAILDPSAAVVAGYRALMPPYRGHLSNLQLDDLVAFIGSLREEPSSPVAGSSGGTSLDTATIVDPVCGMEVTASTSTSHAALGGRTYYFCSDLCRDRFLENPERYLHRDSGSKAGHE